MFQSPSVRPRRPSEEERPFWISYADLMTAMMVLFLATMAITIVAVSKKMVGDVEAGREKQKICEEIKRGVKNNPFVNVGCSDFRITFGEVGRFEPNKYYLVPGTEAATNAALAELVPVILRTARTTRGQRYLKKVVVEGYASPVGSYLRNLHLSMQRSEWVMCLLIDPAKNDHMQLSEEDSLMVQKIFLAGGVSFNEAKGDADDESSRRVEMRLEFYGIEDNLPRVVEVDRGGTKERCNVGIP